MRIIKQGTLACLLLAFICLISSQICALGVSPGKVVHEFEPNLKTQGTIAIINSDHRDVKILITITGELAPYIALDRQSVSFSALEGDKQVLYNLTMPSQFEKPGIHEATITLTEIFDGEQAKPIDIGAALSVTSKIQLKVPYPGKYAQAQLEILSKERPAAFIFLGSNDGKEFINEAGAKIDIYDGNNNTITQIQTQKDHLNPGERKEFIAFLDSNISLGNYKAMAVFYYDGTEQTFKKEFTLGDFFIRLLSLRASGFKIGDVARLDLLVENLANIEIDDLTWELDLVDFQNSPIGTIRSTPESIDSLSRKELPIYWPAERIKLGEYHGELIIRYGGDSIGKDVRLIVQKDRIEVMVEGMDQRLSQIEQPMGWSNIWGFLAIAVLIAAPFMIWMILYFRRKVA